MTNGKIRTIHFRIYTSLFAVKISKEQNALPIINHHFPARLVVLARTTGLAAALLIRAHHITSMPFNLQSHTLDRTFKTKVKRCMLLLALTSTITYTRTASAFQSRAFTRSFAKLGIDNLPFRQNPLGIKNKNTHQSLSLSLSSMTISHNGNDASVSGATTATQKAKYISASEKSLKEAGARIRSGHLVSFPTETVYGLGCHAIDQVAVSRVFEAKERPLTDPLIVHVNEAQAALQLWNASSGLTASGLATSVGDNGNGNGNGDLEQKALEALAAEFWPGPLTIVAKASPEVPSIIMANTGFVACRSPSHPIARALISASGVPIAAPSANKFGHVSPTRASHVMDDLAMEDVWIVDPDMDNANDGIGSSEENQVVCDVGVESTVAKVEMLTETIGRVTILRHGAVSSSEIAVCLDGAGLSANFEVIEKMQATGENVSHVAPGQTIRHYSPNVKSFMISHTRYTDKSSVWGGEEMEFLQNAVVIDFAGRLSSLEEKALAYRDLSSKGDPNIAAANVFDALRWSENIEGAQRVYFPEIVVEEENVRKEDALMLAVKDRLTRAASGVVIETLQ